MGIYLPGVGTLGCEVWPGAGITHSLGVPPGFNLPHMHVGLPFALATATAATTPPCPLYPSSPSLPLLPIWVNVSSLNPCFWDFHRVEFSESSGCYLF